ncbi:MAG: hypothetical protein HRU26_01420 [Psychroserpens sp.]|nr:hypothetical protein [Psychroserpens sp.]
MTELDKNVSTIAINKPDLESSGKTYYIEKGFNTEIAEWYCGMDDQGEPCWSIDLNDANYLTIEELSNVMMKVSNVKVYESKKVWGESHEFELVFKSSLKSIDHKSL